MNSETAIYKGFEFEAQGFPAIAIINTDLHRLENKARYAYAVFIDVLPEKYNAFGHPEGEEYDYLLTVENTLIDYLEKQTETVHVGQTTLYRKREIIFYTAEPEKVESYLEYFLSTIGRENRFEIDKDPEWENVAGFYGLL